MFVGSITKNSSGKYVLHTGGSDYQLDDQSQAGKYDGKDVKVTGQLDNASNTIRVQSIEPSSLNALVDDEPNDLRVREPCSDAEQNEEHTGPIQPALGPHDGRDASKLAAHTVHSPIFVSFSSMHASSSWNLLPRSIGASH